MQGKVGSVGRQVWWQAGQQMLQGMPRASQKAGDLWLDGWSSVACRLPRACSPSLGTRTRTRARITSHGTVEPSIDGPRREEKSRPLGRGRFRKGIVPHTRSVAEARDERHGSAKGERSKGRTLVVMGVGGHIAGWNKPAKSSKPIAAQARAHPQRNGHLLAIRSR
jgi:hypothetical protein